MEILSTLIQWAVIIGLIIWLIKSVVFVVRQQQVEVIERFGKYVRTARAGLNLKIPFVEKRAGNLSLRIQELAEDVLAKSLDNAFLTVPVKVQYKIDEDKTKEAFYSLQNQSKQVSSYIVNTVRSTASEMTMEEIFKSKTKFEEGVNQTLNIKFGNWGFTVMNVLVDNPIPSQEVRLSFDKVISSKRLREAAENEAEAIRIKTVAGAKAEAESLTLKAKAYVDQRKTIAEGMTEIADAKGGVMLNYLIGIDTRDMVRDASKNGAVVLVPTNYETGNMGSLIASLKALEKNK